MKHWKLFMAALLSLTAAPIMQSCDDDDYPCYTDYVPNALVTLKTNSTNGEFYLQLDDETTLWPTNVKQHPYGGKEVRALVNFRFEGDPKDHPANVHVNWIDTIRTKPMAAPLGTVDDEIYGNDPLEILKDWTTVVEDGYFTLRFSTRFGGTQVHELNLVKGEGPYEVVLHHNAHGDTYGQMSDGMIAFRLDQLPDTGDETVDLTVRWMSFSGEKSATFKYRTRK